MKSTWIVVDVEADGEIPYRNSMVCFGAAVVEPNSRTFYGQIAPVSRYYNEEALAISGFSREEHEKFPDARMTMNRFVLWLKGLGVNPIFVSDNPAYDWQWINYYLHTYVGKNPFGFSARRIGDLYCGFVKDVKKNSEWKKKFRKTAHSHHPVDDALGNVEALLAMKELGLNIP